MANKYDWAGYIPIVQVQVHQKQVPRLDYLDSVLTHEKFRMQDHISSYTELPVTEEYKYAPELIAYDYYGTVELWWIITDYNGIINVTDPVNGVVPGIKLKVPDPQDVENWLSKVSSQKNATSSGIVTVS